LLALQPYSINEGKYHNIMDKIRKAALPNGGTAFSFH